MREITLRLSSIVKGPDGVEREYRTWNANGGDMGVFFLDVPMTFIGKRYHDLWVYRK